MERSFIKIKLNSSPKYLTSGRMPVRMLEAKEAKLKIDKEKLDLNVQ